MNIRLSDPAAETVDLSWSYGEQKVLEEVSVHIQKHRFTSILGPNGSGKTTFLKQLLHILPVEKETVFIDREDVTGLGREHLARKIGLVPQNERINYQFSVRDMVQLGRYAHHNRETRHHDLHTVDRVMELTAITHLQSHLVTELSGGEYQRVVIARALAQEPDILALDEPTTYLDPHHQLEILRLLRRLIGEEGVTVVCVLHDLNSAMSFSDNVILLHQGRIYGHGAPQELLRPEILKEVYGITVKLVADPFTGRPLIAADTRF